MITSGETAISKNTVYYLVTLVGISFIVTACLSVIYYLEQNQPLFLQTLVTGSGYLFTLILFQQKRTELAIHTAAFIASTGVLYASFISSDVIVWIPTATLVLFLTLNRSATIWTRYILLGTIVILSMDHMKSEPIYNEIEAFNILLALITVFVISGLFLKRLNQQQQEIIQQSHTIAQEQALLRQAEAEKQISSGVAHLINNEMQVINNYSYLLLQELKDPRQLKMLHSIHDNSLKAGGHATQLLHFSNSSNIELFPTSIRQTMVDWKEDLLLKENYPKHIRLNMDLGESDAVCNANRTTFFEMLDEIWENAVEACDDGGVVNIRLEENSARQAVITVEDNGHGMSDEVLQQAFKPFYSTRFTGRGMGLASIRGIMNAHMGTVAIESEENKGTIVTLTLPLLHPDYQEQENDSEPFGDSCPQT